MKCMLHRQAEYPYIGEGTTLFADWNDAPLGVDVAELAWTDFCAGVRLGVRDDFLVCASFNWARTVDLETMFWQHQRLGALVSTSRLVVKLAVARSAATYHQDLPRSTSVSFSLFHEMTVFSAVLFRSDD